VLMTRIEILLLFQSFVDGGSQSGLAHCKRVVSLIAVFTIVALTSFLSFVPEALAQKEHGSGESSDGHSSDGENYEGVSPGISAPNPLPRPEPGPPQLVWTGFQPGAGEGRVFLQTTEPVPYELRQVSRRRTIVTLRDCRIHLKNNTRELDTRFFETPVASIQARQKRGAVQIAITLKQPVEPQARSESGPEGSQFLVVTFPVPKGQRRASTPDRPLGDKRARQPAEASR